MWQRSNELLPTRLYSTRRSPRTDQRPTLMKILFVMNRFPFFLAFDALARSFNIRVLILFSILGICSRKKHSTFWWEISSLLFLIDLLFSSLDLFLWRQNWTIYVGHFGCVSPHDQIDFLGGQSSVKVRPLELAFPIGCCAPFCSFTKTKRIEIKEATWERKNGEGQ